MKILHKHGKDTLKIEITNISTHGIWLLTNNEELFMSFEDFPWFKTASIEEIINVEEVSPEHYYWPKIDIDLTKEIIKNSSKFPLKAKG